MRCLSSPGTRQLLLFPFAAGFLFVSGFPAGAMAATGSRMVRVCSANGVYYVSLTEDEEETPGHNHSQACHAVCHMDRKKTRKQASDRP